MAEGPLDGAAAESPAPPAPSGDARLGRLRELADSRATGTLRLGDGRGGRVILVEGEVAHVESALTPGLEALLLRPTVPDDSRWAELVGALRRGDTGPAAAAAAGLVRNGTVSVAHAEILRRGALADAALAVLGPAPPDGVQPRFEPGRTHWWVAQRPSPVSTVLAEVRRRRAVLDRMTLGIRVWRPVGRVAEARLERVALSAAQWDVLRLADGTRTPLDIAWFRGHGAFATTVAAHQLARLGLLEAVEPSV